MSSEGVYRRAFLASLVTLLVGKGSSAALPAEETVYFNTNSHKYHCATCKSLRTCTHCVKMPLSQAKARGTACKICGGSCR